MPRRSDRQVPRFPDDPVKFLRVAYQRLGEAQFLFEGGRHAATIYLGGYSVECALKSLILSIVPKNRRKETADSFRGSGWHKLNRLIEVYIELGGPRPPATIAKALIYLNDEWSVDLRYLAGEVPVREASKFLESTSLILEWTKSRI